jgi:hypothetical protein
VAVAAYDSALHHVGLGASAASLNGLVLVGPYNRGNAGPVLDKPSDIGTGDLTGQRQMSRWTQNDYSGGEFQDDWQDPAMFAECIGMLPNQLTRAVRTVRPIVLARAGEQDVTWNAGDDLVQIDQIDGYVFATYNRASGFPEVVRLNPSSPSGTGCEFEGADICSADSIIGAAAWNHSSERLWIGSTLGDLGVHEWVQANAAGSRLVIRTTLDTPGLDLAEPTVSIRGIHIFGQMKFVITGHGDVSQDDNRVWLYVSNTGGSTEWKDVGVLPGSYVASVTYNNAVYILTRKGSSQTQLSMTQGDQIFPVLTLPYFFQGQAMVEYAGRLYIGGIGRDLEGDVHHGELHEVNGTSLRLVRTFAAQYDRPDPPVDAYHPNRKRAMKHFKMLGVAEGLLWMPDSSYTGVEVYDATTDSFFGGPRLRTGDDSNLEFTHVLPFGDSLYLWGVTSDIATTGFYRTERRADAGGTFKSWLVTSDFHPEPAAYKVWSRFATLTRYAAPVLAYSVDGGITWASLTVESTTTQGDRYERFWSLADVPQSRSIRFRIEFDLAGTADEDAAELVSHSLSFLIHGETNRRWQFQVNTALAVDGQDGRLVEQVPGDVSSLLWSAMDGSSQLVFRDIDGTDYNVVVTDVQEQVTAITPDCESFISVTLLEV